MPYRALPPEGQACSWKYGSPVMHNIWQYPRACARAQERKYSPGRPYYRVLAWHCVLTRPVCSICLVVGGGLKTWRENADQKKETQEARCPGFRVVLPWHLCESDVRPGCPVCVTLFWNDREALRSACLPLDGPCTTPSSSVFSILVSSAEKGGPPSVHHSQPTLFHACITGFYPTSFRPHPSTVRELRVVARSVMMPSCQKI